MNTTEIKAFIKDLETQSIGFILDHLNEADAKIAYIAVNDDDGIQVIIPDTDTYFADDGNCEVQFDYSSHADAAQEYVDDGSWGEDTSKTQWISVRTYRKGVRADGEVVEFDSKDHKITLDAKEPDCTSADGHDWITYQSAQGHGGGVVYTEVCAHCAIMKRVDTWDHDPCDGQQGLESVEYSDADDDSKAFVVKRVLKKIAEKLDDIDAVESYKLSDERIIATLAQQEGGDFDLACNDIERDLSEFTLDYWKDEDARTVEITVDI